MSAVQEQGFILIAVLWVSLMLSIFALNAATKSRLQGLQAMNIQNWHLDRQVLESGLDIGQHQLGKYQENQGLLEDKQELEFLAEKELELWHPRFEPYSTKAGDREVLVQVLHLQGKLNINEVDVHLLQDIVEHCGLSAGVQSTEVANSILDWRDGDDLRREGGAEKDYYLALSRPYLPKNGDIQNIKELLLVKGINQDIFQGTAEHPGLKHFFSVHGAQEQMNINSAAPETFAALLDLSPEIIQDILDRREQKPINRLAELGEILPVGSMDQLQKYYQAGQEQGVRVRACIPSEDQEMGRCRERLVR